MATRDDLLAWARSQLGTVEHGGPHGDDGNVVVYWDQIHHHEEQGCSWCDAFVEAGQEAVGVPVVVDSQYCATVEAAYRKAGRLTTIDKAQPGDQVFFHFDGEHAGANHTGIVESIDAHAKFVTSIEGNTTPGSGGRQANGGGVYRRTRSWAVVHSVGQPTFDTPKPVVATAQGHPQIGAFSSGPYVTLWQTMLRDKAGQHQVTANGHFDAATVAGTENFQRFFHLTADGVVGDQSWSTMLAIKG